MYPIVFDYSDEDLIRHLEEQHPEDLAMVFTEGHRRFASRRTWDVYHDHWLHRAKPDAPGHEHKGYLWSGWERGGMTSKGWVQKTPCRCLQPPSHQADCTGRQGVIVLGETAGPSAMDRIWAGLDTAMGILMDPGQKQDPERPETVGMARGMAIALACMMNPADPDESAIRKEAVKRWKERQNG